MDFSTLRAARRALVTLGLLVPLAACGGGAHDALRPDQPTASDALGRSTIKPVEGKASPLIVDWKAEERADLEEIVHDGIAIVAWDDKGFRLLKGCKLAGDYGYLPVQVKKDVVRLESADDVRASLPLGGLGIAGKIGGGFESGKTIDIALAMVGKRRTTWRDVKTDDLKGSCEGATHYVRAILVGAFTMKTGTKAKAAAAAEIFGAGMSSGSESAKDVGSTDGKVEDCDKATGEETKPPGRCSAILRIELEPIGKGGAASADAPKPPKQQPEAVEETAAGCAEGFVFTGGACKKATAELPHLCAPGDAVDCKTQCEKGDAPSCDRLGSILARSDRATAANAFLKACDGGVANGCANLGVLLAFGAHDMAGGVKALELGCRGGSGRACELAGEIWMDGLGGTKDVARAVKLYAKGCEGGDFVACTNAGFLFTGGGGAAVPRDDAKAIEFGRRACFGGEAVACGNVGYKVELGEGVTANPALAVALYERACKLSTPECFRAGMMLATGAPGVVKDGQAAKKVLDAACQASNGLPTIACVVASTLYGSTQKASKGGLDHTVSIMKGQCDSKEGRACTFLGIAEYGLGQKADANRDLKLACSFKDNLGCELARVMK